MKEECPLTHSSLTENSNKDYSKTSKVSSKLIIATFEWTKLHYCLQWFHTWFHTKNTTYIFLNDNAEPTDLIRKLKQKEFKTPIKRKTKTMHHHHIESRGTKTMEKIGKLTPYPHKRTTSTYTQFPNRESHQRTVRSYLEKYILKNWLS